MSMGASARAQDAPDPVPAPAPVPNPIRLTASLDGVQSVAVNSTALETRPGTGTAVVTFDLATGDLTYDISFQNLQAQDITMGPPDVNPDGSTPAPGTVNGNVFPNPNFPFGAGLFLLHFHVGARGANGPIPIDIIAATGPAIGVQTVSPDPIFGATTGRVTGSVNIFDLDGQSGDMMIDGILLNGVPVDGRDDGIRNATCTNCGFIEAILSNNVYVNIHTFNNPFGETRGQLLADTCTSVVNTVQGLRASITALDLDNRVLRFLLRGLNEVEADVADGRFDSARSELADLAAAVVKLSGSRRNIITIPAANDLNCSIANVINGIPPAPPAPAPDPVPAPPADDMMMAPPADDMMMAPPADDMMPMDDMLPVDDIPTDDAAGDARAPIGDTPADVVDMPIGDMPTDMPVGDIPTDAIQP